MSPEIIIYTNKLRENVAIYNEHKTQNEDQQNQKTSTKNKQLEKTEVAINNGQSRDKATMETRHRTKTSKTKS